MFSLRIVSLSAIDRFYLLNLCMNLKKFKRRTLLCVLFFFFFFLKAEIIIHRNICFVLVDEDFTIKFVFFFLSVCMLWRYVF